MGMPIAPLSGKNSKIRQIISCLLCSGTCVQNLSPLAQKLREWFHFEVSGQTDRQTDDTPHPYMHGRGKIYTTMKNYFPTRSLRSLVGIIVIKTLLLKNKY